MYHQILIITNIICHKDPTKNEQLLILSFLWQYQFFKIVHNVAWTIAVAPSSTHYCQ